MTRFVRDLTDMAINHNHNVPIRRDPSSFRDRRDTKGRGKQTDRAQVDNTHLRKKLFVKWVSCRGPDLAQGNDENLN